jgi:hypothetical protein
MDRLTEAVRKHSNMDDDQIMEAGEHGADAGWPGFTYTTNAAEFFQANAEDIWELLSESAEDQGMNIAQLIGSFVREDMIGAWPTFQNLLAWFALEECGRYLADKVNC